MVGLQFVLITYNYTLILSRSLYFDNYTIYSGLLSNQKLQLSCHYLSFTSSCD